MARTLPIPMASAISARSTVTRFRMFRPVAGIYYPFINIIQDSGFKKFAAETKIIGTVNTAANAGGTGLLKVVVYYVMD
jgi:hypothetical protein